MSKKPQGPYTLWIDSGYDGWQWEDHDTLGSATDALAFHSYAPSYVIMRPVNYRVVEGPVPGFKQLGPPLPRPALAIQHIRNEIVAMTEDGPYVLRNDQWEPFGAPPHSDREET